MSCALTTDVCVASLVNNVPYVTEQAINDPIFALRLELSEFSIARDFFRNITGNYTAQPWTIPAYEFSAYYYAQIGFHQISLVVLDFGIGLVSVARVGCECMLDCTQLGDNGITAVVGCCATGKLFYARSVRLVNNLAQILYAFSKPFIVNTQLARGW
jgi:hypothetical protein